MDVIAIADEWVGLYIGFSLVVMYPKSRVILSTVTATHNKVHIPSTVCRLYSTVKSGNLNCYDM